MSLTVKSSNFRLFRLFFQFLEEYISASFVVFFCFLFVFFSSKLQSYLMIVIAIIKNFVYIWTICWRWDKVPQFRPAFVRRDLTLSLEEKQGLPVYFQLVSMMLAKLFLCGSFIPRTRIRPRFRAVQVNLVNTRSYNGDIKTSMSKVSHLVAYSSSRKLQSTNNTSKRDYRISICQRFRAWHQSDFGATFFVFEFLTIFYLTISSPTSDM